MQDQQEQTNRFPLTDEDPVRETETTPEQREQLILEHLPQVRLIARRIYERIPGSMNLEDLISAGIVGLISAIDRFDVRHAVKLRTYAEYKIRGAILDSLRGLDWVPRQHRRRSRQIETAIAFLEQTNQRMPEEEEIASYLGVSVSEYHEWLSESRSITIGSLESTSSDSDGGDVLRYVADAEETWPSELVERSQLEAAVSSAIEKLPKMERTILNFYYYEEMTLREIAKVLNLHESRISQLKTQAILRLRSLITKHWTGGS